MDARHWVDDVPAVLVIAFGDARGVAWGWLAGAGCLHILAELLRMVGPASAFVAAPIFALANAVVAVDPSALSRAAQAPVTWAVPVALQDGTLLGVTGAIAVALGGRFGQLPAGVRPAHVLGMGCIAGLGFTVALLVTNLAYTDTATIQDAKIAIFAASLAATVAAAATFTVTGRRTGR
jgi:NhaA family Na+:H+ antiporter